MRDHKGYEVREMEWKDLAVFVAYAVAIGFIFLDLLVWRPF